MTKKKDKNDFKEIARLDAIGFTLKDKNGKTVFDGRDLYRKKTKKEV